MAASSPIFSECAALAELLWILVEISSIEAAILPKEAACLLLSSDSFWEELLISFEPWEMATTEFTISFVTLTIEDKMLRPMPSDKRNPMPPMQSGRVLALSAVYFPSTLKSDNSLPFKVPVFSVIILRARLALTIPGEAKTSSASLICAVEPKLMTCVANDR
jgi:hypothetical protein